MFACRGNNNNFAWDTGMSVKARRSVVCLLLVVGFVLALPQNPRSPLNFSDSAILTRTDRKGAADSDFDLSKLETGAVCTGAPDVPKDTVPDVSSNPEPAPVDKPPLPAVDRQKEILSLIHYPYGELGFNIAFMGSRLGYRAMTLTARRRIEVYLRPGESADQQAYDLAHELGHAFDLKYNDDARRRRWRELRGIKMSTPWFGCDACPDYATPAGDFAETFAFLLLGPGNFHSMIAPLPGLDTIQDLAAFCHVDHLNEGLEAAVKNRDRSVKVQTARSQVSRPAVKENRTTETAANMSKAAQIPDDSGESQIQNRTEQNLSDFRSPQKETPMALRSSEERLFDVRVPEESQQLTNSISLPGKK